MCPGCTRGCVGRDSRGILGRGPGEKVTTDVRSPTVVVSSPTTEWILVCPLPINNMLSLHIVC